MPRNNSGTASRPASGGNPAFGLQRGRRDWRRIIQIGFLVLLVLDLLFVFLTLRPVGLSSAEQKKDLEDLRSELKGRREKVATLQKIEAGLAGARQQGDEFYTRQFLPNATGYSTIMEEVDRLAAANGVRKGSVAYVLSEVKNRGDLEAVEITTSLEGEYSKIVQFINRLEQSRLFLIVDSMMVASGQGRTVKLAVRLVTYFRTS